MKITLFTLDLKFEDDKPSQTIDAPLHKLCLSTWSKIKAYFENKGYEVETKIYKRTDPEFIYVYDNILKDVTPIKKGWWSDVFRMYILSKYPNHIWLDWDVFILDNFELNENIPFLMKTYYFIYNGTNLDLFKTIYEAYDKYKLFNLVDQDVSNFLINNNIIDYQFDKGFDKYSVHCFFIDDQEVSHLYFINTEDEKSEFVQEHLMDKQHYRFINPKTKKHHHIMGLYNQQELKSFLLENYDLTEEQKEKLLEE